MLSLIYLQSGSDTFCINRLPLGWINHLIANCWSVNIINLKGIFSSCYFPLDILCDIYSFQIRVCIEAAKSGMTWHYYSVQK